MNCKRPTKDEYYINIALTVSERSTCLRRHYGCVIVKDDIIIATGYNGSPRGQANCCDAGVCQRAMAERYSGYEKCESVHAEQNALIAASRDRLLDSTVYLACADSKVNEMSAFERDLTWHEDCSPVPCPLCLRMLINAGVKRIVNRMGDVYVRT